MLHEKSHLRVITGQMPKEIKLQNKPQSISKRYAMLTVDQKKLIDDLIDAFRGGCSMSTSTGLNRILLSTAGFLSFGIALIILTAFWDAIATHHDLVMRVLALCVIALSLSLAAYVSVNVFLALEYRALENKFFKESKQQIIQKPVQEDQAETIEQKVLEMYQDNASLNSIALEVYGKRGGAYNNKIREILRGYEIEI